jgi:hypothetical protein
MKNPFEKGPETIPTKEEVMEIILRNAEHPEKIKTLRELHDDIGLTLLDLRVEGEKSGETTEYLYTKKGLLPNGIMTHETSIEVSYYQDGKIVGGDRVAIYDEETGEWKMEGE